MTPPAQISCGWRAEFTSAEVNQLHAEAFEHRVYTDHEWDWRSVVERHSLGWVVAREAGRLVGFVNVIWDGAVHAWLQDVMVSSSHRGAGLGRAVVAVATDSARSAGCEWLHVDFDPRHRSFYLDRCGFRPAEAGLIALR